MRFDIFTLFPNIFEGFLSESLLKEAIKTEKIQVILHNFRDWATNKHQRVDDTLYGGGAGMLMMPDCVVPCIEEVRNSVSEQGKLLLLTPQGKQLDQKHVEDLATNKRLLLMCGRYEGFDERVLDILQPEEISIGDFVLNGGELAAMIVVESVTRLLPNVLGNAESHYNDSFSQTSNGRLLECAHYTKPREYRGLSVPDVLLSGNHQEIAKWREQSALERTKTKRPDLLNIC